MRKRRVTLRVFMNLAPEPGDFHTEESARKLVQEVLRKNFPHNAPNVKVLGVIEDQSSREPTNFTLRRTY